MQVANENNKCFIVWSNKVEGRLDPHFYKPDFLDLIKSFKNSSFNVKSLKEISEKIASGATPKSGGADYTPKNDGVAFIRSGDINENGNIDFDNILYVKKEIHNSKLKSSQLKRGDVLIAIVGATIGEVSVYNYNDEANINQAIALVRCKKDINPEYIKAFMLSGMGQKQLDKIKRPVARANINLDEIGGFKIPIPPLEIQNKIVELMQSAYDKKAEKEQKAKNILSSIDDYILGELSIKVPEVQDKKCFYINSQEVEQGRLDCYYYQPKFRAIKKAIKTGKYKIAKLKDTLADIKKGVEVGSNAYISEGIPFVRVSDIDDFNISMDTDKKISPELYQELKSDNKPEINELLYSKDGSIGFCVVVKENKDFIVSGGVLRLKVKKENNNYYIKTILSSKTFKTLAEHKSIGAIIKHLLPEELLDFEIPLPPLEKQEKIVKEIKGRIDQVDKLNLEAQNEIEEVKQKVEKIILGK